MIAFRVNDALELDRTQAKFQVVTQFKTPGSFLLADEAGTLADRLERSIPLGLNYRVLQGDNQPVAAMPPTSIPVGRPGTLDRPLRLAQGGYQLWLQGQERPGKEFVVDSGRWLILKVVPGSDASNLKVIRGLYASELFPFRPSRRDRRLEWMLSALQNREKWRGPADGTRARKNLQSPRSDPSIHPAARRVDRAGSRERSAPGNRDPSCGIAGISGCDMERGSDELASRRPLEAAGRTGAGSLVGSGPASNPSGLAGVWPRLSGPRRVARRKTEVAGGKEIVESVSVETHTVMIDSERSGQQPCLVVRIAYPHELPVRVRVDALGIAGSEERFYQEAEKTMRHCSGRSRLIDPCGDPSPRAGLVEWLQAPGTSNGGSIFAWTAWGSRWPADASASSHRTRDRKTRARRPPGAHQPRHVPQARPADNTPRTQRSPFAGRSSAVSRGSKLSRPQVLAHVGDVAQPAAKPVGSWLDPGFSSTTSATDSRSLPMPDVLFITASSRPSRRPGDAPAS